VGLLYGRATGAELARAACAAAVPGITVVEAPLTGIEALAPESRALAERSDALWLPADPTIATPEAFQFLLDLSLERHKPFVVFSEALVHAGALLAVVPDYAWTGAAAAGAARRILSGERAGDVPLAGPLRTRVVVNAEAARALGREAAMGGTR
jgi:putative tryptophan/tyrosine transport system substrate-binding protein